MLYTKLFWDVWFLLNEVYGSYAQDDISSAMSISDHEYLYQLLNVDICSFKLVEADIHDDANSVTVSGVGRRGKKESAPWSTFCLVITDDRCTGLCIFRSSWWSSWASLLIACVDVIHHINRQPINIQSPRYPIDHSRRVWCLCDRKAPGRRFLIILCCSYRRTDPLLLLNECHQ